MRIEGNDAGAYTLSLLLHAAVLVVAWLSSQWAWRMPPDPAAGEPIGASLELSAADLRKAQQAIDAAEKANPPPPQPVPESRPQDADTPLQPTPQAPLERPDTVDQEQVVRNAIEPSAALEEQEARRRQEQVDLTEDLVRQQEAEERQRLRAQQEELEAIRRERAEAARLTRMEEQRLAQLADAARPTPSAKPAPRPAAPSAGERGIDEGLKARYIAALNATARDNWNTGLAPELIRCDVRFTQIPGGEVINVEFMACPYDAQGRESVERALRKTPMPYSGFEPVFQSKVTLTFCYPEEACPQ